MEDRIHAMVLAHQKLYQSQNLSRINLHEYIVDLFAHLRDSYQVPASRVSLVGDMEDVAVLTDTAVPCGLVLNELFSNVFKHAFPENRAEYQLRGEIAFEAAHGVTCRIRFRDDLYEGGV